MSQQLEAQEVEERSLRDATAVLRSRKWSIVLTVSLIVAGTFGASLLMRPSYRSQARILVDPPDLDPDPTAVVPNLETERELVMSIPVAQIVAANVGYSGNLQGILEHLSVRVSPGTEILEVEYEHSDPNQAARIAQAFSEGYLFLRQERARGALLGSAASVKSQLTNREEELQQVSAEIEEARSPSARASLEARVITLTGQIAALQEQLALLSPPENLYVGEVIEPAEVPLKPSSPNYVLYGVLSVAVGLILGTAFAFLRERLDDRVKGEEDFDAPGTFLVAPIPRTRWRRKKKALAVTLAHPQSEAAEAYRSLRARLLFIARQQPLQTILLTSPGEGEGKSSTAANLAVVLAQAEKRVILVSADLRRPRLHHFFDAAASPGLTDILTGKTSWREAAARTAIDGLSLLPSGAMPRNPGDLLQGDQMSTLLEELTAEADFVLLDSAPVLDVADSLTLGSIVHTVLLVTDAQVTSRSALHRARRELEQVGASVVGAVLNRFDPARGSPSPGYIGYRYSYSAPVEPPESFSAAQKMSSESGAPSESLPRFGRSS